MHTFEQSTVIPCEQRELFEYHANPGAINRLIPPWENVRIEHRSDSLQVGSEVIIRNSLFGIPLRWHAKHTELNAPYHFQDVQLTGPFHTWIHDHLFASTDSGTSKLTDSIQFEMPLGPIGKLGLGLIREKLEAMFAYRHATTLADLKFQNFVKPFLPGHRLRIGVTGSSGLIGQRLVDLISVLGFEAIRILRPGSSDRPNDYPLATRSVVLDAKSGFNDVAVMNNLDAVIHLAGKGIASSRWTEANKQSIRDSRIEGTRSLVQHLLKLQSPPKAFVCASGVGIYGNRGADVLDESAPAGNDFLSQLATDWESAAGEFSRDGGRVACGRLGIAIHPRQGALAKLLLPFQLGLGGPIGDGRQYWSWIHVDDAAAAFLYLAINPNASGPYNLVAPEQVDNRQFATTLGQVLHRPSILPAPAFAMRILLGEMADAMLLSSTRASCNRLLEDGFPFRTANLQSCLRHVLGRE